MRDGRIERNTYWSTGQVTSVAARWRGCLPQPSCFGSALTTPHLHLLHVVQLAQKLQSACPYTHWAETTIWHKRRAHSLSRRRSCVIKWSYCSQSKTFFPAVERSIWTTGVPWIWPGFSWSDAQNSLNPGNNSHRLRPYNTPVPDCGHVCESYMQPQISLEGLQHRQQQKHTTAAAVLHQWPLGSVSPISLSLILGEDNFVGFFLL